MKRILAILLALCMFACLLPLTVMADPTEPAVTEPATTEPATTEPATTEPATTEPATTEPVASEPTATEPEVTEPATPAIEAKVKCYYASKKSFTLTINPGTPAYITGSEDLVLTNWTDKEKAPETNFVKFELVEGEPAVMKVTFNNFVVDCSAAGGYTCHGIEFQSVPLAYDIEMELIGENTMTHTKSACIKYSNNGSMTITGAGSLTLNLTGAASGALWGNGGDLFIKNTTVNLMVDPGESNNSAHHGIFMAMGNVVLENVKSTSTARGGSMVYIGTTDKEAGGTGKGRSTPSTDVTRTITVKDCDITCTTRTGATFLSAAPAKISGSTLKLTKNSSSGKSIFVPAPEFEGDFTAIAGLAKNAEKLDKLKEYNANKLGSYTYIYAVPGIVDLLPTEPTTEATEPEVTIPEVTIPEVTEPVTQPTTEATEPATQPATEATTPETTEATTPDVSDGTSSGSPLKVVLIIVLVLIVVTAAALVAILVIRKKRA